MMFLPDDPRLRAHSMGISEARRHLLKRKEEQEEDMLADPLEAMVVEEGEQISLFQAVAATASDNGSSEEPEWFTADPFPAADQEGVPLTLFPPPTPGGKVPQVGQDGLPIQAMHVTKATLRKRNADLVRLLVRRANMDHKAVNLELNRLSGIKRISDATADQLEQRLEAGEKWLTRL